MLTLQRRTLRLMCQCLPTRTLAHQPLQVRLQRPYLDLVEVERFNITILWNSGANPKKIRLFEKSQGVILIFFQELRLVTPYKVQKS